MLACSVVMGMNVVWIEKDDHVIIFDRLGILAVL